jgi:hypothetical protein
MAEGGTGTNFYNFNEMMYFGLNMLQDLVPRSVTHSTNYSIMPNSSVFASIMMQNPCSK